MTREAGYSLSGVPGARGGTGSDVVDSRSALYPTAVHVPSLVPLCVARYRHLAWPSGRQRASVCACGGTGVQVAVAGPLALLFAVTVFAL